MANNQQIAKREEQMMGAFELENVKTQLTALLQSNPRKIEAFKTRMLKISLSYGLDKCTPESLINCGLQALTLDLPLEAGQGYIVNYGGVATFDSGYKGWQVLAKRAGLSIKADVVYACDNFEQDGFGFEAKITFQPDYAQRRGSDDDWAKQHLTGVIVSVREDETGLITTMFVPADMIFKIIGKSPSAGKTDKNGRKHSPHDNWAEQMFAAKAIKQVLSKQAIDLAKHSQLQEAIGIVNNTESVAQSEAVAETKFYDSDKFNANYPKWVDRVKTRRNPAMAIITQLTNTYSFNEEQLQKLMELRNHEPIEGEATEVQ